MKRKLAHAGFTLIELLVVISIISFLSSIILASVNVARAKAKIAAIDTFEKNNLHTLGANSAVSFEFNEGSGSSVLDSLGNGVQGTLNSITWSNDTFDNKGSSLAFSSSLNSYISIPSSYSLGISNSDFTVSTWIKTTQQFGQGAIIGNAGGGNGFRFGGYWNASVSDDVYFGVGNGASWNEGACTSGKAINDGQWHLITGVFKKNQNKVDCYIDGELKGTAYIPNFSGMIDTGLKIGGGICCGSWFTGNLDNVRIYRESLTAEGIRKIYATEKKAYLTFGHNK